MNDTVRKVAIVTGAAQGIGLVIAEHFARAGYEVAAIDSDNEALDAITERDVRIHPIFGDVSNETSVPDMIKSIVSEHARIDALVNNAAIAANTALVNLSLEDWNRVLSVNLTGPFLMAKHCAPHLKASKGAIVNIASTRALMSEANTEAYSASKGGVLALTHALCMSLAPEVRVNAISPGWIEVSHLKKPTARRELHLSEADHSQHPAGRVGVPEDIASLAVYLASEQAGFITGQNFVVDGGMTKKMIYVS